MQEENESDKGYRKRGESMPEEEKKEESAKMEEPQEKVEEKSEEPKAEVKEEVKQQEEPAFDAKVSYDQLKTQIDQLSEALSARIIKIEETLNSFAEEEAKDEEEPNVPPVQLEKQEEKPEEKKEEEKVAQYSKDLTEVRNEVSEIKTMIAKLSNQGTKRTIQSSSAVSDPIESAARENLERYYSIR